MLLIWVGNKKRICFPMWSLANCIIVRYTYTTFLILPTSSFGTYIPSQRCNFAIGRRIKKERTVTGVKHLIGSDIRVEGGIPNFLMAKMKPIHHAERHPSQPRRGAIHDYTAEA